MRKTVAIVALVLVLVPTLASAGAHTGRCRRIGKQIDQYDQVAAMAASRGDRLWHASTEAHIDRLENKLYSLCPHLKPNPGRDFTLFLYKWGKLAIEGAKRYYTGGWL